MFDDFNYIILAIIEGFTELLPISSTGHMLIANHFLNSNLENFDKTYIISIQAASIFAIFLYNREILLQNISIWLKISIGFLPVGITGFLFYKNIRELLSDTDILGYTFIIGGIALIWMENRYNSCPNKNSLENLSYKDSFYIGVWQCLSLIPGMSRSGSSIFGAMVKGFDRDSSTKFSFLLGLPTIAISTLYDMYKNREILEVAGNYTHLITGFFVSFVCTLASISFLMFILKKYSFKPFGYYRVFVGFILLYII